MTKLKRCPLCGCKNIAINRFPDEYGTISCMRCGYGSTYGLIDLNIAMWNIRPWYAPLEWFKLLVYGLAVLSIRELLVWLVF